MRLQPIHVPGTHFQLLKGQKSTTSKTHSLTAFILLGARLGFRAHSRKVETRNGRFLNADLPGPGPRREHREEEAPTAEEPTCTNTIT
jgi:hypothetical protein